MKSRFILIALTAAVLVGCKAKPIRTTAFLGTPDGMVNVPSVKAFHILWAKPKVDWDKFKKIHVAPVNTQHLTRMGWYDKMSMGSRDPKGVRDLAEFTRKALTDAQRKNRHKYALQVVDKPDAQTLVLELAITEIVPTKAWLNAVGYAALFMAVDKGSVAMEGRCRDAGTSEVVIKFADREKGKQSLLNVKDLTWRSHAHAIIQEWAAQSVQITNAEEYEVIEDSSWWEWKLW